MLSHSLSMLSSRVYGMCPTNPTLNLDFVNNTTLDSAITFTRASTATYFDATGTLQSAAINTPRFDYNPSTLEARGLLIEEQRTNRIRNNTMVGAVVGTPGTVPTNWVISGLGTLTQEIVGVGTDAGVEYIDFRLSGTTSTTNTILLFDSTTQITAASGQSWASSFFVKLQSGSTTNITSVANEIRGYSSAGVIQEQSSNAITLTASLTRNPHVFALANAGSVRVINNVRFNFASGAAIDITLRIGLPQLELGAFATSVIPTTTTALTRNADVASVNTLSPWFNATEGTLFAQSLVTSGSTNFVSRLVGAANNIYMANGYVAALGVPTAQSYLRNGVAAAQISSAINTKVAGTVYKEATRYSSTSFRAAANGTLGNDITPSAGIPTVSKLDFAAFAGSTTSTAVGQLWLQRFTYYPRSFPDAELQSITA